jgi:hypothetical protein
MLLGPLWLAIRLCPGWITGAQKMGPGMAHCHANGLFVAANAVVIIIGAWSFSRAGVGPIAEIAHIRYGLENREDHAW